MSTQQPTGTRAAAPLRSPGRPRCPHGERGFIVIWAVMSLMLIAGIIVAGSDEFAALDSISQTDYAAGGQAQSIAEAGLVDAYAWMRRQPTQPVAAFTPQLDLSAAPEINETEDPSRGLVRTFEIAPSLWARYEVLRGTPPESYTDANGNGVFDAGEEYNDTNGDGKRTPGQGTRDVSSERGLPGTGTVWLLESVARVFRRPNASLPLGVGPNRQIGGAKMATEVRRLNIVPPAAAALCSRRGDRVSIGSRGRIRAKTTAIAHAESTGSPNTSGGEVPGAKASVPGYKDYVEDVFGVDWTTLRSMADISTSDPVEGVPAKLADFALVVISGDVVFDEARPLRGTALVIVQGNVTIASGSNSFFNGVLYVDGNLTARAPAYLRGVVICTGTSDVRGSGGDYCEIEHDPDTIGMLQVKMGQYRYTKSRYIPAPKFEDGRANESITIRTAIDPLLNPEDGSVPEGNFATDDMIDAIESFLLANPTTPGLRQLGIADLRLREARNLLTRDPPNREAALAKLKDAFKKLKEAAGKGADIAELLGEVVGGPGKVLDDALSMTTARIDASTADASDVEGAQADLARATERMAEAAQHAAAGALKDAFDSYEDAADSLKKALGHIE